MFESWPFTNFHDLNLDWILSKIQSVENRLSQFEAFNRLTWKGDWNPAKTYTQWSIVRDSATNNGYLALQTVPANVELSNTDYWVEIADYDALYSAFGERITQIENVLNGVDSDLPELPFVTPEMFGAVGDGVTDDTTALQAAVDSDKMVLLMNTTYVINNTLTIKKNVNILGGTKSVLKIAGKITTDYENHYIHLERFKIKSVKASGNAVEIMANNTAVPQHTLDVISVDFEQDTTVTDSECTLLYLYGVRESQIIDCSFHGDSVHYSNGTTGIRAVGDSSHLTMNNGISGCEFFNIGIGIHFDGSPENLIYLAGFRIINNTIIGCYTGILAEYIDTPSISYNMIDYCTRPLHLSGSVNITIDQNYIQTPAPGSCINIEQGGADANDNITIINNYIHSTTGTTSGSDTTDGITLAGYQSPKILRHITITGNTVFRVRTAVNIEGGQFAEIKDNTIYYCKTFIDANNSLVYSDVTDNYVQIDVANFILNNTSSNTIGKNRWGERHTSGRVTGEINYTVAANSSASYTVTYNDKLAAFVTPTITATFKDAGTSWADMFITVSDITALGCTIKVVNGSNTAHSNVITWSVIV